jgi:hypothetical protein|tara:strand:- start:601 stop:750 length:150 start_codon:yes stop_codon:yes gene_type:complete
MSRDVLISAGLQVGGAALAVIGIAMFSIAAAFIAAGVLCVLFGLAADRA